MEKKVVALIVTYNRITLLRECLNALYNQKYTNLEVCVIDNGSTDTTEQEMRKLSQKNKILYFSTGKNLGGAGGFNFGINKLVKMNKYDYIWIMDDDTIPNSDALLELMKATDLLNNNFGFLASSVLFQDQTFCKMNNPGILRNTLLGEEYKKMQMGLCRIDYASFVSILFPVSVIKIKGLPIKEFFIWKDDYEYTTRISNDYPCYIVSKSIVIHKIQKNMLPDIAIDSADRINRYFYEFRNGYFVIRGKGLKAKLFYYSRIFKTLKSILQYRKKDKMKCILVVLKGILAGWFFKPSIEFID